MQAIIAMAVPLFAPPTASQPASTHPPTRPLLPRLMQAIIAMDAYGEQLGYKPTADQVVESFL